MGTMLKIEKSTSENCIDKFDPKRNPVYLYYRLRINTVLHNINRTTIIVINTIAANRLVFPVRFEQIAGLYHRSEINHLGTALQASNRKRLMLNLQIKLLLNLVFEWVLVPTKSFL